MNDKRGEKDFSTLGISKVNIPQKIRETWNLDDVWDAGCHFHGSVAASQGVFPLFSPWKTWIPWKSLRFPFPVGEEAALSRREVEPEVRASFPLPGGSWDVFIQSGIHTAAPYSRPGAFPGSSRALALPAHSRPRSMLQCLLLRKIPTGMGQRDAGMGDGRGVPKLGDPGILGRDKERMRPRFGMGPWPRNAGKFQWLFPMLPMGWETWHRWDWGCGMLQLHPVFPFPNPSFPGSAPTVLGFVPIPKSSEFLAGNSQKVP